MREDRKRREKVSIKGTKKRGGKNQKTMSNIKKKFLKMSCEI